MYIFFLEKYGSIPFPSYSSVPIKSDIQVKLVKPK